MSAAFNRLYLEVEIASKPRFTRNGMVVNIAIPQQQGTTKERLHAVSTRPEVTQMFGTVQRGAIFFLSGELRTKPARMAIYDAVLVRLPTAGAKRGPLDEEQDVSGYQRMLANGRVIVVKPYKRGVKKAPRA